MEKALVAEEGGRGCGREMEERALEVATEGGYVDGNSV